MQTTKQLALVGNGKMGKLIGQLAPEYGFSVALRLDSHNNAGGQAINRQVFAEIDAAIEFSSPEAAPQNLRLLSTNGVSTVTGTTGWYQLLPEITKLIEISGSGLVWSPNFSTGVAVFRKAVALTAKLMASEDSYGAWAWEIHHDAKKDAPSGTLLELVDTMKESGYTRFIDVSSSRAGKHPGTHEIGFDSAADTITLRHTSRSREGFARGALKAAQWIEGRKGVYTFDEVLFGDIAPA